MELLDALFELEDLVLEEHEVEDVVDDSIIEPHAFQQVPHFEHKPIKLVASSLEEEAVKARLLSYEELFDFYHSTSLLLPSQREGRLEQQFQRDQP